MSKSIMPSTNWNNINTSRIKIVLQGSWYEISLYSIDVQYVGTLILLPLPIILLLCWSWMTKELGKKLMVSIELAVRALTEIKWTWNWGTNNTFLRRKWLVNYTFPDMQVGILLFVWQSNIGTSHRFQNYE